jgi:hypothetical protein
MSTPSHAIVDRPGPLIPSLAYHRDLASCLRKHEDGLWDWFSSDKLTVHADKDARLYLLKNAVRLDKGDHPEIHAQAGDVAGVLGIKSPVTLYQGSNGGQRNAMLVGMTSELAIFFGGDILSFLTEAERRALLAHEMAHFVFKSLEAGRYNIADNLLTWICNQGGQPPHQRSLWLSQLYQEIYADRVAIEVCGGMDAPLALLVKVSAGITTVSPQSYLNQAEDAFDCATSGGSYSGSSNGTHPDLFIRALAMRDWLDDRAAANVKLRLMVEGAPNLDTLDLLQQAETTDLTRAVVEVLIKTRFAASERLELQAREYFPDFDRQRSLTVDIAELTRSMREVPSGIKPYFCYVLADFTLADPDLDDYVLLEAIRLADQWDLTAAFNEIAAKDLGIDVKRIAGLRERVAKGIPSKVRADREGAAE